MILKRFARTIEIEVSPEQFVFRCDRQEHRVPTRGYVKKVRGEEPSYAFELEPKSDAYVAISLFSSLHPEFQQDIVHVLGAFLLYGMRPLCGGSLVRPVIVFKGVESFETGFGFEYVAFREAAKLFALGEQEVYFKG